MFQSPKEFARRTPPGQFRAAGVAPVPAAARSGVNRPLVWRRKKLILAVTLATLAAGLATNRLVSPLYRATTVLLIAPPERDDGADIAAVESAVRVLTSDTVLRRAAEAEHLVADAAGVRRLRERVTARRSGFVVDLTAQAGDPVSASRLANAIAAAYLQTQTAARDDSARPDDAALAARLDDLKTRLQRAEQALARTETAQPSPAPDRRDTELADRLAAARLRSAEAKARYDQILQLRHNPNADAPPAIAALRRRAASAARREAVLAETLGPRHPDLIDARAERAAARAALAQDIERAMAAERETYNQAAAAETALGARAGAAKPSAAPPAPPPISDGELAADRAAYDLLSAEVNDRREQQHLAPLTVQILAQAQEPRRPNWPPRPAILLPLALLLGLGLGLTLAMIADWITPPAPRG